MTEDHPSLFPEERKGWESYCSHRRKGLCGFVNNNTFLGLERDLKKMGGTGKAILPYVGKGAIFFSKTFEIKRNTSKTVKELIMN